MTWSCGVFRNLSAMRHFCIGLSKYLHDGTLDGLSVGFGITTVFFFFFGACFSC